MALDGPSAALAEAIEAALPDWVERSVDRLVRASGRTGATRPGAGGAGAGRAGAGGEGSGRAGAGGENVAGEDVGGEVDVAREAASAGRRAAAEIGAEVRRLLETDVERQPTTPLGLLREAFRYPAEVLRHAGVPPVDRDEMRMRLFPDDQYDLAPASFADVGPDLALPGLVWGASKAAAMLARSEAARSS